MSDPFAAADQANRLANMVKFGVITEVALGEPTRARVEFEAGWVSDLLPVFQLASGRVRSWSAPIAGEQVCVLSPSGEITTGAILRGLPCAAFAEPSAAETLTVIGEWDDGASDHYDEAEHARTIIVPEGGSLTLMVGALSISVGAAGIELHAGGQPITLTASAMTLDGPVNLGGSGGKAVARHGDSVVGGLIVATTTSVKAA